MSDWSNIQSALNAGGVVLLPTETVYGLACRADDNAAVEKIYVMKGRDFMKTLAVCVKDVAAAQDLGMFTPKALDLAKRYWPGSLTLIVEAKPNIPIDENCLGESGDAVTIAFRCPDADWRENLTEALALTSANRSGDAECTVHAEAMDTFGGAVAASLENDAPLSGSPSTIVSVVGDKIKIFRQGDLEITS